MFAQGNRIKGHRGARIHKTTGQESSQGGIATTNKFYQHSLHKVTTVGIFWIDFFTILLSLNMFSCVSLILGIDSVWLLLLKCPTLFLDSPYPTLPKKASMVGRSGVKWVWVTMVGGFVHWLGMVWDPPCIVLTTINPALQLGSPPHEANRWPINWSQKRQRGIRAKAMKIKIESFMVHGVKHCETYNEIAIWYDSK